MLAEPIAMAPGGAQELASSAATSDKAGADRTGRRTPEGQGCVELLEVMGRSAYITDRTVGLMSVDADQTELRVGCEPVGDDVGEWADHQRAGVHLQRPDDVRIRSESIEARSYGDDESVAPALEVRRSRVHHNRRPVAQRPGRRHQVALGLGLVIDQDDGGHLRFVGVE